MLTCRMFGLVLTIIRAHIAPIASILFNKTGYGSHVPDRGKKFSSRLIRGANLGLVTSYSIRRSLPHTPSSAPLSSLLFPPQTAPRPNWNLICALTNKIHFSAAIPLPVVFDTQECLKLLCSYPHPNNSTSASEPLSSLMRKVKSAGQRIST